MSRIVGIETPSQITRRAPLIERALPNIASIANHGVKFDSISPAIRPERLGNGGVMRLNEKQLHLIQGVQDILNGILENMEKDEFHAPAPWLLENLWATLEAVKRA